MLAKEEIMSEGIVFDIKEFAVFDGPGIRTTVFMKGCPLRCQWCHNPEGLSAKPQLMVSKAACVHCGACEKVCESPDHCTACGRCVPVCRGGFRKICGTKWDSDALAARLSKDRDVYALSDGGVTFSGGEPLMQWDFVRDVFTKLNGIHRAIETSGYAPDDVFRSAMETCDLIMMDWKVSDPELHKKYTGVEQSIIREHAKMLAEGETPFIIRMPIIPTVNDNEEHFKTVAEMFKKAEKLVRVDILPYQQAAGAKYEMVGKTYTPDFDEMKKLEYHTEFFEQEGIDYRIFR